MPVNRHRRFLPSADTSCGVLIPAAAIFYVWFFWFHPPDAALYRPDSASYVDFHAVRAAGYPLFLLSVRAAFGGLEAVPGVQLVLSAAAYVFLGQAVRKALGAPVAALAVVGALLVNPYLPLFQHAILTESIFISLLCVMTGTLFRFVARPAWPAAAAAAAACGLAVAVRPAALSLLPIWPIALWCVWPRCAGRRGRIAAAVAVPLAACFVLENTAWRARHGSVPRPNIADAHIFSKVLMLPREPVVEDAELTRFVAAGREALAPARELVQGAPDPRTRAYLLWRFEDAATWATYDRVLREEAERSSAWRGVEPLGRHFHLRGRIAWPAVAAAPAAWARNAFTHYRGLWTASWGPPFPPDSALRYNAWMDEVYDERRHGPLFDDARILRSVAGSGGRGPRAVLAAGFLASVLAAGLAGWQRLRRRSRVPDPRLAAAALAGLMVHGHFLLIGLVSVFVARYAATMFPLLAVCGLLLADWVIKEGARRLRRTETT